MQKKSELEVNADQLLSQDAFLDFCRYDERREEKINRDITVAFLEALEKDELLLPLKFIMVKAKPDSSELVPIKVFSPFQIFIVAMAEKNSVNEEGLPMDYSQDIEYQKKHNSRYVSWWGGGTGYNATIYKSSSNTEKNNPYEFSKTFHSLLEIIHSLSDKVSYENMKYERERLYRNSPKFQYELNIPKEELKKTMEDLGLDLEKIKTLKIAIGGFALRIDPLGKWFEYIDKHPQSRKDLFQGRAILAQELYGLCKVINDLIEYIYEEKQGSLLKEVDTLNIHRQNSDQFASGGDIFVIKDLRIKLKELVNGEEFEKLTPKKLIVNSKNTLKENVLGKLDNLLENIKDFERRYGERRFFNAFGSREIFPEENIKIEGLDEYTKHYVTSLMSQRYKNFDKNKKDGYELDIPEILSLWNKGKVDEAYKLQYELEEKYEISRAIESRLDDIARMFVQICVLVERNLGDLEYEIDSEKRTTESDALRDFSLKNDSSKPDFQQKYSEFWRSGLKEYTKDLTKKKEDLDKLLATLRGFINRSRYIYCIECRKKFVKINQNYGDRSINKEAVCESCFSKISNSLVKIKEEEWKKIKSGEQKCDCGQLLFKFALENTISLHSKNEIPIRIELEYGKMNLIAKCKKCSKISNKSIDWGWTS